MNSQESHKAATSNFDITISKWLEFMDSESVILDPLHLQRVATATFSTSQKVLAVVYPRNRTELVRLVGIANRYEVPLYPVSRGRNWGLGSRVPVDNSSVVVDLGKMNRILEFNDSLSYITVEPGATFEQVSDYLLSQNSRNFLSVIGGPPDASIIGNALERGEGLGPLGDRASHVCNMEVLLANGEIVSTGYDTSLKDEISPLTRHALGPDLSGLFFQSNLGIVLSMTIWLNPKPAYFHPFCLFFESKKSLELAIPRIRKLQEQGVIKPYSFALWNRYKLIASQGQYPWSAVRGRVLSPTELLKETSESWKGIEWFGFGALYSSSKLHAKADIKLLKKELRGSCKKISVISSLQAKFLKLFSKPIKRITGTDVSTVLDTLYYRSVYLGHPTNTSLKSTYWRKKIPLPKKMNPDRDACGVIWLCNIIPFEAKAMTKAANIVETICLQYGLEPNIAQLSVSTRKQHMFTLLVYDRLVEGADERAQSCQTAIAEALRDSGFFSYRLAISEMNCVSTLLGKRSEVLFDLKKYFDPKNIFAPGRYSGGLADESKISSASNVK